MGTVISQTESVTRILNNAPQEVYMRLSLIVKNRRDLSIVENLAELDKVIGLLYQMKRGVIFLANTKALPEA